MRALHILFSLALAASGSALAAEGSGWTPVYHSDGLQNFTGKQRAAVAAGGVVWKIEAGGIGQERAIGLLRAAGAAAAWKGSRGSVFFRARRGEQEAIASKAFAAAQGRTAPDRSSARPSPSPSPGPRPEPAAKPAAAAPSSAGMKVESVSLRLRGAGGMEAFFGSIPKTVTVLPFGAGQLIRASGPDVAAVERLLVQAERLSDPSGRSDVAVGAPLGGVPGAGASVRIRTPKVSRVVGGLATLDVEGQSLLLQPGDLVLVVQANGSLMDAAVMKIS